jgi:hypothetical protein
MKRSLFGLFDNPEDPNKLSKLVNSINSAIGFVTKSVKSKQRIKTDPDVISGLIDKYTQLNKKQDENNNNIDDRLEKLFSNISPSYNRLRKYAVYDELYSSLMIIKNIIKVYINNLTQTDIINNRTLFIKPNNTNNFIEGSEDYARISELTKHYIEFFDFEDVLKKNVLPNLLRFGDFFIEVVDLTSYTPNHNKYINEDTELKELSDKIEYIFESSNSVNFDTKSKENTIDILKSLVTIEDSYNISPDEYAAMIMENETKFKDIEKTFLEKIELNGIKNIKSDLVTEVDNAVSAVSKKNNKDNAFNRILLRYHKPHNIIPVISGHGIILGYIQINEVESPFKNQENVNSRKITTLIRSINKTADTESDQIDAINKFSKMLVSDIYKRYKIKTSGIIESDVNKNVDAELFKKLEPEIFYMIKKMLYNIETKEKFTKLNIRFILPTDMIHYSINESDNYPFGGSIIEPLVYVGKLYMLTQMINLVTKFSRSSLIRTWKVETGARKDQNKMLQNLISSMRSSKLTADSILSGNGINSIPTDFRDMVTFTENGKEKVSMTVSQHGDPNIKIQDLEDLRRELIALSGIRASLLGFPDDMGELREHLIHTNIRFATDIHSIQNVINPANVKLFNRIHNIICPFEKNKLKELVNISLMPPTVLIGQMVTSGMDSVSQLNNVLTQMGIISDPYLFLNKFVPWIDWEEFKAKASIEKTTKATAAATATDNGYGG